MKLSEEKTYEQETIRTTRREEGAPGGQERDLRELPFKSQLDPETRNEL